MNDLRLALSGIRSPYLRFTLENAPGARFLELRVLVLTRRSGTELGFIGYYSPWRDFVLYPRESSVWSDGCLRDIGKAIEITRRAWKEKSGQT